MKQWIVAAFLLGLGAICVVVASDLPKTSGNRPPERPVPKISSTTSRSKGDAASETLTGASTKLSPQETAVKHVTESLLAAYKRRDAKAFAATFTLDGEYMDSKESVFHGRKAIADEFATFFREQPGSAMEIKLSSTRSIARNLITADFTTHYQLTPETPAVPGRCRIVCVREADVWLIASLHESPATIEETSPHHSHVRQLEWLVGDWIGEGRNCHVHFSCHWDESGHYLLREFTIEVAGSKPLSGIQRIGYDPILQSLKIWVFDSAGGFSDGYFYRDGETWILKTSGVTFDGQLASTTNVFTQIDSHRMMSETVEHILSGERISDGEKLTIVRKPSQILDAAVQDQRRKN